MVISRQTAFKIRIIDILGKSLNKDNDEWSPNYIKFGDLKISRINMIANVIMKSENDNFSNVVLDDGTGTIKAKIWGQDISLFQNAKIGDFVLLLGRIREFNGEIFIAPEIVKVVDPLWAKLRKLELDKLYGESVLADNNKESMDVDYSEKPFEIIEEKIQEFPIESNRQKILGLVEKFDTENGAAVENILKNSSLDAYETNKILEELLKEGEIFQVKVGKLKLVN